MSKNLSIQYYNVFAEENSKYHLSVEELYLYGILSIMRNRERLTITNVDVIDQYSSIKFFSREKESKQRIRKHLLSLKEKGIIHFENEKIDNKSLLIISFTEDLKDDSIGKGVKGFESIDIVKFNSFSNMIDNYIYFTVKRFDKLGGFKCDYERWSHILGCTEKTAQDKINDAIEKKVIYKNIGDYKDEMVNGRNQKRQEQNTYKTIPFGENEKSSQTKKVELKQATEKREENLNVGFHSDEYVKEIHETMYFFKTYKDEDGDVFPMDYHYAFYLEVKDNIKNRKPTDLENEFIKVAEKRIGYLKNNPQFKKEYDSGEEIYRERLKEKIVNQLKDATNAVRMKDGTVVIVDENNVNSIDWKKVKSMFYGNGTLKYEWEMNTFQPIVLRTDVYDNRPDMIEYGWELYKNHVKTGKMLTYDLRNEMQEKVFRDKFSLKKENEQQESYQDEIMDFYELSLVNEEINNEKKKNSSNGLQDLVNKNYKAKKKDDRDISEFIDPYEAF